MRVDLMHVHIKPNEESIKTEVYKISTTQILPFRDHREWAEFQITVINFCATRSVIINFDFGQSFVPLNQVLMCHQHSVQ